jgi:hypothetical protein
MIVVPVRDSHVKVMALMSGWREMNSPAEFGLKPCTRLNTPSVTPAACITSAGSVAVSGSEGFWMKKLWPSTAQAPVTD